MKLSVFSFLFFGLISCRTHSSDDEQKILPNNGSLIDLTPKSVSSSPEATLSSPNSLISCNSMPEGDTNRHLINKKFDILENLSGEDRAYKISYSNTCRLKGATADNVPTGIVVRAQPDSEGVVGGMIYLNHADSFVLRGRGNVRVELLQNASFQPLYEPGCGLTVTAEVVAGN